jgi:hypothetical protein
MRFTPGNGFGFEYDDSDEGYEDETEAMMADAFIKSNQNREIELKLAEKQMKIEMLEKAIGVAKGNWFWGLMPSSMRSEKIIEAYDTLKMLMD